MSFKEKLKERIEKNAIKSQLTWTDKKGIVHTENVILKRSRLPIIGDWARIYPPVNENDKINWANTIFGGRKNLIKLLITFGVLIIIGLGYWEQVKNVEVLLNNPCINLCINPIVP